ADHEDHVDLRVEHGPPGRLQVGPRVEGDAVGAGAEGLGGEAAHAPVVAGDRVEDVGAEGAHGASLSRRRWVILASSPAATRSSVSGSWSMRSVSMLT